jgi:hypothetical protein
LDDYYATNDWSHPSMVKMCHHDIPHVIFICQGKLQSLGVMHPWHHQEISHLITLCKETQHGTPTGELLQVNAEQFWLDKLSLPGSFTDAPLKIVAPYTM